MSLSQRKRPELATQPRKRKDAARTEVDPQLAFMLARHGMTRWQFDAERFIAVAEGRTGSHRDRMLVLLEAVTEEMPGPWKVAAVVTRWRQLAVTLAEWIS